MDKLVKAIMLGVTVLIMFSCGQRKNSQRLFHWSQIDPVTDSLTDRLESQFVNYDADDKVKQSVRELDSLAHTRGNNRIIMARNLFWQARWMQRRMINDSALVLVTRAMELTDSDKYEYDFLRMRSVFYACSENVDRAMEYAHIERALKLARKNQDIATEAQEAVNMGNLLVHVGESDKGMFYHRSADSLYQKLGFEKYLLKNRINIASQFYQTGQQDTAVKILKSILQNPAIKSDPITTNTVYRNLYLYGNEPEYLLAAYNQLDTLETISGLRAAYAALLVQHYFKEHDYNKALRYDSVAMSNLFKVEDFAQRSIVYLNHSLSLLTRDSLEQAYYYRTLFEAMRDSNMKRNRGEEVMRMSALHEINMREARYQLATYKRNVIWGIVIGSLFIACAIAYAIMKRRQNLQHIKMMEAQLSLEKARRKFAMTNLAIEEKNSLLNSIKSDLSEMRSDGKIRETEARRIESTIKFHLLQHDSETVNRNSLDIINPQFPIKMREISPGIDDSYIKLASYILMDLDNKRIAQLMGIKPESVHQSRWRLRRRLSIPPDVRIEDFLRKLNEPLL